MSTVHQFAYGAFNPIGAYLLAWVGSTIGLGAAAQARDTDDRARRFRWLVIASSAMGAGIWLMHFVAMIGFDVPESPVRYEPWLTALSAVMAVVAVSLGMFLAGYGPRSRIRVLAGGLVTGAGIAATHYTGVAAVRLAGTIGYDTSLVAASVLVAVAGATAALWFSVTVRGWWPRVLAAAVTGAVLTGVHYTGMAALRVHAAPGAGPVEGVNPIRLVLPITLIVAGALIGLVFTALQAASQEAFGPERPAPVIPTVHVGQMKPASPRIPVLTAVPPRRILLRPNRE